MTDRILVVSGLAHSLRSSNHAASCNLIIINSSVLIVDTVNVCVVVVGGGGVPWCIVLKSFGV